MKILLDARMYGLEHTGIGRYLVNLIEELQELDNKNKFSILLRKKYFHSLKLSENWKKVLADYRHYSLTEQIKLPSIIKEEKPDLVHFPHFNIPVFWKGKFIVTLHDMSMHKQGISATKLPLPIYYLKRLPYKYAFGRAVNNSQKIITPTKAVKKELVRYFDISKDKVVPIQEGIGKGYGVNHKNGEVLEKYGLKEKFFIYTGNAYPHKNLRRAIEAVVRLNKKRDGKVKFAIAGARDVFKDRLKKLAKELKAEEHVRFLGFVSDKELSVLYKKSVGFVYPSLSEGFGLQGLEVMAAGGLVLASNIPVFREVYEENAVYFNPYDFSSIVKAMKDVLEMKKEKRERIIKRGKKFVKRYSWKKMAKKTLDVYENAGKS